MKFTISDASPDNLEGMLALYQRLAEFEVPSRRRPEELWAGDALLTQKWADGMVENAIFKIALDSQSVVVGTAFARLRPEALSQKPSAHLEVLVVADNAEGHGVGRALVEAVEVQVKEMGASSLTLNVFRNNKAARGFYQKLGFDEELIRCIKEL